MKNKGIRYGLAVSMLLLSAGTAHALSPELRDYADAAYAGNLAEVKRWIEEEGKPINPESTRTVNGHPWHEFTPLAYAVSSGNRELVRYLVERGAEVNVLVGTPGWTPLTMSIRWKPVQPDMAEYLLDHGADPTIVSADPDSYIGGSPVASPIFYAAYRGFPDLFMRMAEMGASWDIVEHGNRKTLVDNTCIHYSHRVKAAADLDTGTPEYNKEIEKAKEYLEILEYMIDRGGQYKQVYQGQDWGGIPEGHGFGPCPGLPSSDPIIMSEEEREQYWKWREELGKNKEERDEKKE